MNISLFENRLKCLLFDILLFMIFFRCQITFHVDVEFLHVNVKISMEMLICQCKFTTLIIN